MTLLDQRNEPVREMRMEPASQPLDLQSQLIKLASDPNVDVAKLERLVQMVERNQARIAEDEFNGAMNRAQTAMRPIAADAENPQTRSDYASYGQLDNALRPIYTKHLFSLSFNTGESPLPDHVRVICKVSHTAGHSRDYHIDMPADGKGAKGGDVMTKTHAVGSAVSYGMRYLLKMIFNVAVGESDDDGNRAGETFEERPNVPKGFEDWWTDLRATGENGRHALSEAFNASKPEYRIYLTKFHNRDWEQLKRDASQVTARQKAAQK